MDDAKEIKLDLEGMLCFQLGKVERNALERAIVALGKQIPKEIGFEHGSWVCTECGEAPNITNCINWDENIPSFGYCPYCGQKIRGANIA